MTKPEQLELFPELANIQYPKPTLEPGPVMKFSGETLPVYDILTNLEPFLSDKVLDFIKNNAPTASNSDKVTYMGMKISGPLSDSAYKKFANKLNAIFILLTPEQYFATPMAMQLQYDKEGNERWMLLWYCSYKEFASNTEAMAWYRNFFDANSDAPPED